MSVAIEIARTLPVFAAADDRRVAQVLIAVATDSTASMPLSIPLSRGEREVCLFAFRAAALLERCDAETVDAVLEVLDRVRAGMCR